MASMSSSSIPPTGPEYQGSSDMMKILVATDNHIGFMEKDPVRYNDSLESFEEILEIAKSQDVDFILLGGDLYHENKPSRQTLHRTMELFRHYCMGSRPCPLEFRSDPEVNFHSKFRTVNYEDPNYNISIPVFTIHGNHDDPVGEGELSAVDILDVSNMVNYFGKVKDVEKIELSPLLLQKGDTRLALYGLGSCRDERLHRTFRRGNVKFLRPSEEESAWFNVLVLHQNRARHGSTNYIPSSFIPDFFDLVVWGHEHECLIEPEFIPTGGVDDNGDDKGIFISQPGSSIATSFGDGEQRTKHCGILYIKSDCSFKMEAVKLRSVRPFIIDSVCLSDTGIHPQNAPGVQDYLKTRVGELVEEACKESDNDKLPLVRLKVDYHGGYSAFSLARFGQQFLERVANPKNILQWHCRRGRQEKKEEEDTVVAESRALTSGDISEFLEEEVEKQSIELLSNKNMTEAIHEFVDKMENDSVATCVQYSLEVSQELLKEKRLKGNEIADFMVRERDSILKKQETEGMQAVRRALKEKREKLPDDFDQVGDNSDSDDNSAATSTATEAPRGRGRGRGSRGRAGTRARGGGKRGRGQSGSVPPSPTAPQLDIRTGSSARARGRGRAKSTRSLQYTDDSEPPSKKEKTMDFVDLTEEDSDEDMDFQASASHSFKPAKKSTRTKRN